MVVLKFWKGKVIVTGTGMTVMLDAYTSILSFVKHETYSAGFVQVKSPVEQTGVQFHIIRLVSITFSSGLL